MRLSFETKELAANLTRFCPGWNIRIFLRPMFRGSLQFFRQQFIMTGSSLSLTRQFPDSQTHYMQTMINLGLLKQARCGLRIKW
jgi:hypothetical protein